MALQIDSIAYLFGRDYRDQPEVRRALEIADRRFKELHSTEMDNTDAHRQFMAEVANALLANPGAAREIEADAFQRGMRFDRAQSEPVPTRSAGRITPRADGSCVVDL